jgi:tight adherence protein B
MKRRLRVLILLALSGLSAVVFSARADAQVPAHDLEVMLAIDSSGSMERVIDVAKSAANEFVASMPLDVRIGVETFGDEVKVLAQPTTDRALLTQLINGIVTDDDTALYDAVVIASWQFTPAAKQRVLVLLSDGKDEGSTATLDEAVAAVHGVQVEAISLSTDLTDINSLSALGTVTSAEDATGVSAAFARVTSLIALVVEPVTVPTSATTVAAPTSVEPTTSAPATTSAPTTTVAAPTTPAPTTPPSTAEAVATVLTGQPPTAASETAAVTSNSSLSLWLGALGIFVGLFVLGLLLFPRERVSKARLGIDKPRNVSEMGKRTISAVEVALERYGKRTQLATTLSIANISMQPGEFLGSVAVVAVVAGLLGLLIGGPVVALLVATAVCLGVRFYVARTKAKRQAAFADQLPDVLQLVTTALRSGYGLTQALDAVAEEAEEPARSEFARVLVESRLGRDLSESMRALAQRIESEDLEWVVAAIDINRDTGGNLSEILNTVSDTVRERQRMSRQVATLTAEGRLSARILTVVPVLMALWQWRVNPDNFALLTHGPGLAALMIAGVLMVVGTIWTRKIVNSLSL